MSAKLEFAVQMTCTSCVEKIHEKLCQIGVPKSDIQVSLDTGIVIVDTNLPSSLILTTIESTGNKAVLKGYGSSSHFNIGAAVAMLGGTTGHSVSDIKGVVRFVQLNEKQCIVDGTIDGLSPGKHGIHVYECGDLSNGCDSIGNHLNLKQTLHGDRTNDENHRHTGDLGNIIADEKGRANFYFKDDVLNVSNLIGRSVAVTENEDDCGKTENSRSQVDGNCGKKLACGIIARSSGLFENNKKICACDGVTLWEERDVPLAGPGRQRNKNN
ncbi:copper chaperone for superoxide dismutase [Adelges cooleyi]|uniref:copper chaperone for superoxide dismutase n=1 Tax=Adelges cooleyi TaxID=133065 RepID=UPI0021800474|nr:copper chaperone for superoxide dismutase [Adelges cooleyi]XP_050430258.1 copper chaperone for superoxide dismutase [Adelges cooleyi]